MSRTDPAARAKRPPSLSRAGRQEAREATFQMLYALELGGQTAGEVERWYLEAHPLAPAVRERAGALLDAAMAQRERIEELLRRHAQGWKLERISLVDRSLLRLATAELLIGGLPRGVLEATLALAKKFSQPGAVAFLHAVLDAIAADLASASHPA